MHNSEEYIAYGLVPILFLVLVCTFASRVVLTMVSGANYPATCVALFQHRRFEKAADHMDATNQSYVAVSVRNRIVFDDRGIGSTSVW